MWKRFWQPVYFWPATTLASCIVVTLAMFSVSLTAAPDTGSDPGPADWTMWGGTPTRNMTSTAKGVDLTFEIDLDDLESSKNLLWTARLGSQTYGNPIVAGGKVLVGTNNGGEYRPQFKGDKGVILCFNIEDGELAWQLTRDKLAQGRVNDWPEQGICSAPYVDGDRCWVVTNRCELMCLDMNGFHDGENNGPYTEETDTDKLGADIIWSLDMIEELGVFPHNLATSNPVIHGDIVYIVTGNGVDEAHLEVPSPRGPSFIAVNKNSGEVVWEDSSPSIDSKAPAPFNNILHGQWGSPCVGEVNGKTLIFMPGGDGILYAFSPEGDGNGGGEIVWWFDLNPKDSVWELGGRGTRNNLIGTPVFYENSVFLGVGQDPEHGEGVGHYYRIDATKTGDVSPVIADDSGKYQPNPNSAQIWHVGGVDDEGDLKFRRTISTTTIHDGLVYIPDLTGYLHCLDLKTGEKVWEYDTFAAVWGSPMYLDGHILLGDEDGELAIMKAGREFDENDIREITFGSSIYTTPTIAGGKMYISDRSRLYCIKIQ